MLDKCSIASNDGPADCNGENDDDDDADDGCSTASTAARAES